MNPPNPSPPWTADAVNALRDSKLSRRIFVQGFGALLVGFSMCGLTRRFGLDAGDVLAQGFNGPGNNQLDAWLAIEPSGQVTAYTGKCELGHGLYTAQMQLIAEELDVPLSRIDLVQCDTACTPDQGTTSGAQSHPTNFNHANLALAAATAREALLSQAASRLEVAPEALDVRDGVVFARADPARRVTYGELIGGKTFKLVLDPQAKRKHPDSWRVMGTPIRRVELPAIATGAFEYVHNVRVPDMVHGQVVRPPFIGATLRRVDEESIRNMPGLVKVVVKNNFVGVVAEKAWQAMRAAAELQVEWSSGAGVPGQVDIYDYLRNHKPTRDSFEVNSKDVDAKLADAHRIFKATYHYPYQMHGSIGSSCAVADVRPDTATLWSATQAVYPLQSSVATVLGMPREKVRVIFRMGSGCYGVNGADTVSYDAAVLSQAVGKPVRVQLSRKDEMAWENYGVAYVIDQRAGVDDGGTIVAWDHESWSPTLGGRPGANNPGNVITGFLLGFSPAAFRERSPAPDPTSFSNGRNAVPSYVTGCVQGRCGGTGTIASQRVLTHTVISPFWTGPLRSPNRLQNTFAHESFMDEIAASLGQDPVEYRLRHLSDRRLIQVVEAAASGAGWQTRRSPRPVIQRTGKAAGRGMACVLYEGDNGYCAMVAEVEVDQERGTIAAKRLVIASDCGPISNPDGLRNQLEGGALHGLSRALLEEVTWDDRKITSVDWRTYRPLFLSDEIPAIETVLIHRVEGEAMGAGETAVTVVAAAIANAVFDATGVRLRQVPFTAQRVKAALDARV